MEVTEGGWGAGVKMVGQPIRRGDFREHRHAPSCAPAGISSSGSSMALEGRASRTGRERGESGAPLKLRVERTRMCNERGCPLLGGAATGSLLERGRTTLIPSPNEPSLAAVC